MTGWKRVSKAMPCPICAKPDGCTAATDGSAVVCLRVQEGAAKRRDGTVIEAKNGLGWLHHLGEPRVAGNGRYVQRKTKEEKKLTPSELKPMLKGFSDDLTDDLLAKASETLGLSSRSLRAFGIGWSPLHASYTFPMFDGRKRPIGIRLRDGDGKKKSLFGSRNGIFMPDSYDASMIADGIDVSDSKPLLLLIPEGPTDAAAAHQIGFRAIGRPSNMGGQDQILELLGSSDKQDVVIVADHDPVKRLKDGTPFVPGWEGALHLAQTILPACGTLKIMRPPGDLKDLRAWIIAGGNSGMLCALIENTIVITPTILGQKLQAMAEWKHNGRREFLKGNQPIAS